MLCRDAQFYLQLRRCSNDELGADVIADLDRHCAGCGPCASISRQLLASDRAIGVAIKAVPIPSGLRDKLLTQTLAYRGTQVRRRAYRCLALAASLFLTVGLTYGVFAVFRPTLDPDVVVRDQDERIQDPDGTLRRWLVALHAPEQLPLPFNTDLLVSVGSERIHGRDVPMALFFSPGDRGFAKVFVIHKGADFKLDLQKVEAQASNTHALVREIPNAPHLIYLIVHTGRDLQPFLRMGDGGPTG